MDTIIKRFNKLRADEPNVGDYPLLCKAIRGNELPQFSVEKLFDSLVSKDQYSKSEKTGLLFYLNFVNMNTRV